MTWTLRPWSSGRLWRFALPVLPVLPAFPKDFSPDLPPYLVFLGSGRLFSDKRGDNGGCKQPEERRNNGTDATGQGGINGMEPQNR